MVNLDIVNYINFRVLAPPEKILATAMTVLLILNISTLQDKEREKVSKDKVTAEQMRNNAMESLSETRKRSMERSSKDLNSDDGIVMVTPKRKSRPQGMSEILKVAMDSKKQANEIRKRELELKAEEIKQNQMFFSKYFVTKQQFQQQQQATNQAFLNSLVHLVKKLIAILFLHYSLYSVK